MAFSRGPVLLARSTRFNDGTLDEPLALGRYCDAYEGEVYRYVKNEMPIFTLERNTVDGVAIQMSAVVPMGLHVENTCGISPNTIHFCGFASAGNGGCRRTAIASGCRGRSSPAIRSIAPRKIP